MVDIKEIKSVRIVPFTLMSSSVSAVLGIIYAIILMVVLGILGLLIPEMSQVGGLLAAIGVGMIFILPIGFFLLNILSSFMVALVYNLLVPRVGGIKVGMHDMKEVRSIAVIPISLIT
ncbi:MAG: hypothetical protein Q8M92_01540, partial [Candidatus Subteraquimicrobiales bacterium]|nr:hypothetical protein [Candidatus Subteraquimicrobiales bacterium]